MVRRNILIVKLGAFGNIVLSMAAFRAIREHHAGARISVLTSPAYAEWLRTFPYFDEVLIDPHPAWWDLAAARRLGRMLADGGFDRVYDLQTSKRSSWYFALFPAKRRPEWSGIAFGCSLPDRDPQRNVLHDAARQQGQLRQAGITAFPPADLSWMPRRHRPVRAAPGFRPAGARQFARSAGQAMAGRALRAAGPACWRNAGSPRSCWARGRRPIWRRRSPADRPYRPTSFGDLAELARAARFAVGNDTGPMHLIATAGCPSITLFSNDSDPSLCAPPAPDAVLQRPDLADLPVEAVLEACRSRSTA